MDLKTSLTVLFTPADFETLSREDLSGTTCVVFDVLRATSSIVTALANGAEAVIPVADIPEATKIFQVNPAVLLAGERDGLRITRRAGSSVEFHLGNSPREFVPETVRGRTIVMTTTNGTRALRAARGADEVLVSSFLNLTETSRRILRSTPRSLVIICSGTFEQTAYEDLLAAGALCEEIWGAYANGDMSDSVLIAKKAFGGARKNLLAALGEARNGKRLLSRPELAADVEFCSRIDSVPFPTRLLRDRVVRC